MRYAIINRNKPRVGSYVLVMHNVENMIGMVEKLHDSHMTVLLLSHNGRIDVGYDKGWVLMNVPDLQTMRYVYGTYVSQNIVGGIEQAYDAFKKRHIDTRKK